MAIFDITIIESQDPSICDKPFEIVERKGIGHPDSICDGIVEAVCRSLCSIYQEEFGRILHHNIDKGLLIAGRTEPCIGGGRVLEPMLFVFGDRGTAKFQGVNLPIGDIAKQAAQTWIRQNLRMVDPDLNMLYQCEIRPGSVELVENLVGEDIGANDTSVGVGYAPLSPTEQIVLAVENMLNSAAFKHSFPESGEDIKVMGLRTGRKLQLIVAMAFIDAFVTGSSNYFDRKRYMRETIVHFIKNLNQPFSQFEVEINSLDNISRGDSGLYLTVLGTSAESGDSGQVGRGNRVNGVISYNRPSTTEAASGKNPVNHPGKIYNLLSHRMAAKVYERVSGIKEVTVWLCSRIGAPLDQPVLATAEVKLSPGADLNALKEQIAAVMHNELAQLDSFIKMIIQGKFSVY